MGHSHISPPHLVILSIHLSRCRRHEGFHVVKASSRQGRGVPLQILFKHNLILKTDPVHSYPTQREPFRAFSVECLVFQLVWSC